MLRRKSLLLLLIGASAVLAGAGPRRSPEQELLDLHASVLQAHLNADIEAWLSTESDTYVVANRGEITRPTKKEREARLRPYLERTRFKEYRDLVPPIVRVSRDGTMGWVIAQVKASGIQRTPSGSEEPIEFTCAWIELFEKQGGRWVRVGNVSNFKEPAAPRATRAD